MQKNDVNHNSNKAQGDSKMDQDQGQDAVWDGNNNDMKINI